VSYIGRVLIRHADPARDARACAEIYGPFVRDTAISFEDTPPDAQELAGRIERVSATHPWLVAEAQEQVLGYAYASPHRDRPAYRWAADVAVYVGERHRRQGVGQRLYGALLPLLTRQGLRSACAGITLPNPGSVALHEKFGFRPVGVYRRIGWKAGAWRDVGWWQAELGPATPGPPSEPGAPARLDRG
jgi:L-amino acid N-acyltransferase YncA